MSNFPVIVIDDMFSVDFGDGRLMQIWLNGEPVRSFLPGWTPDFVFAGFSPVYLLVLSHVDGAKAIWYLDDIGNFIGNRSLAELVAPHAAAVQQGAGRVIGEIWRSLACSPQLALSAEARAFFELPDADRNQIAAACLPGLQLSSRTILLDPAAPEDESIVLAGPGRQIALRTGDVRRLLGEDLKTKLLESIRTGMLSFPSPVDGSSLHTDVSICITEFLFLYRLHDEKNDFVFYVVASSHRCIIISTYLPEFGVVILNDAWKTNFIDLSFGASIDHLLALHLCERGPNIAKYLAGAKRRVTVAYREQHLGHHLWNELTGIDDLVRHVPVPEIPEIILVGAAGSEMYGKVDEIYPELAGRVNRGIGDHRQLAEYAYRQNLCIVRPTSDYISQALTSRVISGLEREAEENGDARRLKELQAAGYTIVLLGLRVENRTIVDLPEFCRRCVDFLSRNTRKIAVVVDGHNSTANQDGTYKSHGEGDAGTSPVEVEKQIVHQLSTAFPDGNVVIIDNIAATVGRSLVWASHAHFFVALWGAGLAKYRWIANKPGFIITNRWNLLHRVDLHIYDSPAYMESPAPIDFVADAQVHDAPAAVQLLPLPGESFANFHVDESGVFAVLQRLLIEHGPTSAP